MSPLSATTIDLANALPLSRALRSTFSTRLCSRPPLVGCSSLLGRLLLASHPVARTTPKIDHSQNANLVAATVYSNP